MKNNGKLLEVYKEKNADPAWKNTFFSLGRNMKGRAFKYQNTNFRHQKSYIHHFTQFEEIEDKDRADWPTQDGHGQEIDKQRVVKMLESKLFKRGLGSHVSYNKTEKGFSYRKYIDRKFADNESWIINYLYLLDGNYGNEKNHVVQTTKEILKLTHLIDINEDKRSHLFKDVLLAKKTKDIIQKDLFYLMSFYGDPEFIEIYFHSVDQEKETLHEYIIKNIEEDNKLCCISHKYRQGGNYSFPMAIDEIKVFYITSLLLEIKSTNVQYVFNKLLAEYGRFFDFNRDVVFDYLEEEMEVFESILSEALNIEEEIVESDKHEELIEKSPLDYIDTTTKQGRARVNQIFSMKKKKARELENYKCSLEMKRNCQNHYFTSKATKNNYVEIHHLIPKEYSNRFSNSIEVFPNYVTLCPSCHQLVHKAEDRERKDHLTELLNQRKERLAALNLNIEIEELIEFYGIES